MAPAGTPTPIVAKRNDAMAEAIRPSDIVAAMAAQGALPIGNSPAELAAVIASDATRWVQAHQGSRNSAKLSRFTCT